MHEMPSCRSKVHIRTLLFAQAAVSTATPHAADVWQSNQNTDDAYGETERARSELLPEILPESPLGVVTCVNQQARTAEVQWSTLTGALESEEVSVFELTNHPTVDVRLGDAVLIPEALSCGRIVSRSRMSEPAV